MPDVVVTDPSNVTVDGVAAGAITDVLANHRQVEGIHSAVLAAVHDWHAGVCSRHQAAMKSLADSHAAATDRRDKETAAAHAADMAGLAVKHAGELAARDATLADQAAQIAALKSQVDALGGTALAQKMAKNARRKAALDAKAKAEADLAALDA